MLRFRSMCRLLSRRVNSAVFRVSKQRPFETIINSGVNSTPKKKGTFSRFLKFGSLGTFAFTGYVTYAYPVLELTSMTHDFRACAARNSVFSEDYWKNYWKYYWKSLLHAASSQTPSYLCESKSTNSEPDTLGYYNPLIALLMGLSTHFICVYLIWRYDLEILVKETFGPLPDELLPKMPPGFEDNYDTLVLDLTQTLVSSNWIFETREKGYISLRPGLEAFLRRADQIGYDIVLYTDEYELFSEEFYRRLPKDVHYFSLTKGSNAYQDGKRYRDLSRLNRDPSKIIYVSAHALENCLQPENCIPIKAWENEEDDTALTDLLAFLEDLKRIWPKPKDLRPYLLQYRERGWKPEENVLKSFFQRLRRLVLTIIG